jgi:hypothetical protein
MAGCSGKEDQKPSDTISSHEQGKRKESVVVVPAMVKGKWKAVKISVTDKRSNKDAVYTVAIGAELQLPNSGLILKVENFLPNFKMEGTSLTSESNEPKNPAAQISIKEGGKEIFKGWLFSLYPTTHAFQHNRFSFSLVDFVPAN